MPPSPGHTLFEQLSLIFVCRRGMERRRLQASLEISSASFQDIISDLLVLFSLVILVHYAHILFNKVRLPSPRKQNSVLLNNTAALKEKKYRIRQSLAQTGHLDHDSFPALLDIRDSSPAIAGPALHMEIIGPKHPAVKVYVFPSTVSELLCELFKWSQM